MARKIRRQVKEDKFVSTTAEISVFLNKHWKKIAGAVAGIIILIGFFLLYYKYTTGRNENAARRLDKARTTFTDAESGLESAGKTESTIEKYENAIEKFREVTEKGGHSYTISEALFYSAKCSYQLDRYDEAVTAFQKVINKYPKSTFALYARMGIGQCYEQLGDDEHLRKAIRHYDELSRRPESYITLSAFINKGRCHEKLKEWDQAIAAYKIIVDKFKLNVELAIQAKSKALVQKAKDVISKYRAALGKDQSDPDFVKFLDEAVAREKDGQEQWFEVLVLYDKAIFSRKEYWSQQKASGEDSQTLQDASNALKDYEDLSSNVIRNMRWGRKYESQGEWENALAYYRRAASFDFLPGMDLYQESQFRIDWINSMEKPEQQSAIGKTS